MDWDARYRSNDTPWDKGCPHPEIPEILKKISGTKHFLVPGCGCGHDAALIASFGHRVTGMDLSTRAIELASARHPARATLSWLEGDFLEPDHRAIAPIDAIFEHTLFCAIEPVERDLYLSTLEQLLPVGGLYVAIFYKNPESDEGPPFPVEDRDLKKLFRHWKLINSWIPGKTFPGREGREEIRIYAKPR